MREVRLLALFALLLVPLRTTAAQDSERETSSPWRLSYFPFLGGGNNDGPMFSVRARYWQPAEYEARLTYTAVLDGSAGFTFRGSRYLILKFHAPFLWDGWRLQAGVGAERAARFGYFGLGNDTEKNDDLVDDTDPFLYRVRRTRYAGRVEVTRRIGGPLQAALQVGVESARFTALPGPSLFAGDFGRRLEQDDANARLALVYDTRDNEYNTHQGLLLETGLQGGTGGDGYSRVYAVLRGYLTVREGTMIAARVAGSGIGGTPPLNARYVVPGWERDLPVMGGEYSHRSLDTGRLAGEGTLFGNLEVRHDLLPFGDLGALTLLGFVDAGRVFEGDGFRFTTDDMLVGGGGGVALRVLRSTIFVFNFAGGPDGFNFSVSNGWMF